MQDWVKEKLDLLDELFPPQRIERSRQRWEKLWSGDMTFDRYPFVYLPTSFSYYDDVHTPEQRLRASLDEFIIHGHFDDDFIPALFPGCKQSTMPNILGAEEICSDGNYNAAKMIHSVEDIHKMPAHSVANSLVAQEWLQMQKYFRQETQGRFPIHVVDMQGPVDVAAQIWSYDELLITAYTDPDAYHKLLGKATEAFIMFWQEQQDLLGDLFVGTHLWGWSWIPQGAGASLSADSLVMISPDFYEEFFKPYFVQVAEHFGGVSIHSCGDFSAVVPNLCRTPGVTAINASQMTVEQFIAAGLDHKMLTILNVEVDNAPEMFELIDRHNLRVDMTVVFPFPDSPEQLGKCQSWSDSQWKQLRDLEAGIIEKLPKPIS